MKIGSEGSGRNNFIKSIPVVGAEQLVGVSGHAVDGRLLQFVGAHVDRGFQGVDCVPRVQPRAQLDFTGSENDVIFYKYSPKNLAGFAPQIAAGSSKNCIRTLYFEKTANLFLPKIDKNRRE
jgi:hypothetical protein